MKKGKKEKEKKIESLVRKHRDHQEGMMVLIGEISPRSDEIFPLELLYSNSALTNSRYCDPDEARVSRCCTISMHSGTVVNKVSR